MTGKAKKFWIWFKEQNRSYLNIDELDEDSKEQLFDELLEHLHQYCDQLYFEVGGKQGEINELIITAEGNVDLFDDVEILVNEAPAITDWSFTAFIQPQGGGNIINFEDVELKLVEMWFLPLQSADKPSSIGVRVCVPNYEQLKESQWFESAVHNVLDMVLGEKSFALDIDYIDFAKLPDDPAEKGMIELAELPAYVKWKKSKSVNHDL